MAIDKEQFRDLCAAYVLDALDEEERKEFEKMLAEADAEMRETYDELRQAALHLPLSAQLVEPPLRVKEKILQAIRPGHVKENLFVKLAGVFQLHKPQVAFAVSLALLVLVIGITYYAVTLNRTIHYQQKQLVALQDELERKGEVLKILQSRKIEIVFMNGTQAHPNGYGKIIWDPESNTAILQVSNLPSAPEDKNYQLWIYIKDQDPVSAGIFTVGDPATDAFFKMNQFAETDIQRINGFLITLEPKDGVSQPSGQMYLGGRPSSRN